MRGPIVLLALVLSAGQLAAQQPFQPMPNDQSAVPVEEAPLPSAADAAAPVIEPGAGANCWGYCPARPRRSRLWVKGEYLAWWIKDAPMPVPILASAPANSPFITTLPGSLPDPNTTVLIGGQDIHYGVQHGGRFTAGWWFDDCQNLGIEASYFFLAQSSQQQSAASSGAAGTPFLTNPFFDVNPAAGFAGEIANFLAFPPFTAGTARFTNSSRLQGAECNGLFQLIRNDKVRFHLLGGVRFLDLQEGLAFGTTQVDPAGGLTFPGQFVNTLDLFDTRNRFYGGQVGGRLEWTCGRFFVQATGKVALGNMHETVGISGFSTTNAGPPFLTTPIPVTTVPGGIYTQPTNIGENSRDRFAVVPEMSLQVGFDLTCRFRVFAGYNFLYVSEVARPGDQIDRTINSSQLTAFTGAPTGPLVGPRRPAPLFESSSFWAHGINCGLSFRW